MDEAEDGGEDEQCWEELDWMKRKDSDGLQETEVGKGLDLNGQLRRLCFGERQ